MFKPCPLCGFGVLVEKVNDNTNEPQRGLVFSEISQWQKDKYGMIPLIWGIIVVKFIEPESKMVVTRG